MHLKADFNMYHMYRGCVSFLCDNHETPLYHTYCHIHSVIGERERSVEDMEDVGSVTLLHWAV